MNTFKLTSLFFLLDLVLIFSGCPSGDGGIAGNVLLDVEGHQRPPAPPRYMHNPPQALKVENFWIDFGIHDVGGNDITRLVQLTNNSAHQIKGLKTSFEANSGFQVADAMSCNAINAWQTCELGIVFSTKLASKLHEKAVISYDTQGHKQSSIITLIGEANDRSSMEVSDNSFGSQKVTLNELGLAPVTIAFKFSGAITANDFEIVNSPTSEMRINASKSDCFGRTLNSFDTCILAFESKTPIKQDKEITENIILKYKLNSNIEKEFRFTLNGKFQIKDLVIGDQDIGAVNMTAGTTLPITISVYNPSGSSIAEASKIRLDQTALPGYLTLELNPLKSTCLAAGKLIMPNQQCDFVLNAQPLNDVVIDQNLKVTFDALGRIGAMTTQRELAFKLKGSLSRLPALTVAQVGQAPVALPVPGAPAAGVPTGPTNLKLTLSNPNFGEKRFKGDSFDISLKVKNVSTTATPVARAFTVERRDPANTMNVIDWPTEHFVQKNAASTCGFGDLVQGQTCKIILTLTPYQTEVDDIDEPLAVRYIDETGTPQEILFNLKGSWKSRAPAPNQFLSNYIISLADRYYSKPYSLAPNDYEEKKISNFWVRVYRPNHGLVHGTRKAALALDALQVFGGSMSSQNLSNWIAYFENNSSVNYNPHFRQQLSFGALMMRTGRSTEKNDPALYKIDTARSAQFFVNEAPKTGLFPQQKDIDDFKFALETIGDKSKCYDAHDKYISGDCTLDRLYIYHFLYAVHHLDLRRVGSFDASQIIKSFSDHFMVYNTSDQTITRLWSRSGDYLRLTGDHDIVIRTSPQFRHYNEIFFQFSKNHKYLREKVEELQHSPF